MPYSYCWVNAKLFLCCFRRILFIIFNPACFNQLLMQYPFNLPVHTPKFISSPLFQRLVGLIINPYYKAFFRTHSTWILDAMIKFCKALRKKTVSSVLKLILFPFIKYNCTTSRILALCNFP